MKTPLCDKCLSSQSLCEKCRSKVENNEISEIDLEVARVLHNLSQTEEDLKNIEFIKAIELPQLILIIVGKRDAALVVGKEGKTIRLLTKKLRKRARILEKSNNDEKIIKDLLKPAEVKNIGVIYSLDGERTKITVNKEDEKLITMDKNTIETIIKLIINRDISLEFD